MRWRRMAELNRKRELNAAAEVKRAEIALAKRYTHQVLVFEHANLASPGCGQCMFCKDFCLTAHP